MRPWFDDHTRFQADTDTAPRACEHAGCRAAGEFKAPHSPQKINQYRWFCLEHVREYNKQWDFAKGLQPDEIERIIRFDTIWQRETRPLGDWRTKEKLLRRKAQHFAFGEAASARQAAPAHSPKVVAAMAMLELDVVPPADVLQSKYRDLVKKYHPDANGGDKIAEERLKDINLAYAVLREFIK